MKKLDVVNAKSLKFILNNPQLKLTQKDNKKKKKLGIVTPQSSFHPCSSVSRTLELVLDVERQGI